jgi:hypothetical protein
MSIEERTYNFGDPFIKEMYDSAEQPILEKIKEFDNRK